MTVGSIRFYCAGPKKWTGLICFYLRLDRADVADGRVAPDTGLASGEDRGVDGLGRGSRLGSASPDREACLSVCPKSS
jgi:hypothetical protein